MNISQAHGVWHKRRTLFSVVLLLYVVCILGLWFRFSHSHHLVVGVRVEAPFSYRDAALCFEYRDITALCSVYMYIYIYNGQSLHNLSTFADAFCETLFGLAGSVTVCVRLWKVCKVRRPRISAAFGPPHLIRPKFALSFHIAQNDTAL